jgi:hypothetical protein
MKFKLLLDELIEPNFDSNEEKELDDPPTLGFLK